MHENVTLFGNDEVLLRTRQLVLASSGLNVSTVSGFADVDQAIQDQGCDLFVLCHSLSAEEQDYAVRSIRKHLIRVPILVLTKSHPEVAIEYCEMMSVGDGPARLIAKTKALLASC